MEQVNSWDSVYQMAGLLFAGDEMPESENGRQAESRKYVAQTAKIVRERFLHFKDKENKFHKYQVTHLLAGPVAEIYEDVVNGIVPEDQIVPALKLYLANYEPALMDWLKRHGIGDSQFAALNISVNEIHAHRGRIQAARTAVGQMMLGSCDTTVRDACRDASDSVAFVMKDAPVQNSKFDGELIRQILEKAFLIPPEKVDRAVQCLQG